MINHQVVVWLKIRKHDILNELLSHLDCVVVWLKIRKHDISILIYYNVQLVVVWLKIRKHDILAVQIIIVRKLWFD